MWNGLPFATREMHHSFESLVVIGTPSQQAFLMDIHHDTSFKFILEDDSISSASRAHIRSSSCKGVGLWLVVNHLSIHFTSHILFSPQRYVFISIWFSLRNLLMCECEHRLDAYGTHLARYLFRGQWIITHGTIWNVMSALVRKNGHVVWKEWRYVFTSWVSLQIDLYMTQED
jgi:hypothetical protein